MKINKWKKNLLFLESIERVRARAIERKNETKQNEVWKWEW